MSYNITPSSLGLIIISTLFQGDPCVRLAEYKIPFVRYRWQWQCFTHSSQAVGVGGVSANIAFEAAHAPDKGTAPADVFATGKFRFREVWTWPFCNSWVGTYKRGIC